MTVNESELQIQVADYLRLQYPDVMFHSDFGSGVKLTPGQAVRQKKQNGGRRAWPDMMIAQERVCWITKDGYERIESLNSLTERWKKAGKPVDNFKYGLDYGLFLELKKEGETLHPGPRAKNGFNSKDGKEYKNEHIKEQADCLYDLRQRGYCAEFAVGFDEAKKIIDEYLGGK